MFSYLMKYANYLVNNRSAAHRILCINFRNPINNRPLYGIPEPCYTLHVGMTARAVNIGQHRLSDMQLIIPISLYSNGL